MWYYESSPSYAIDHMMGKAMSAAGSQGKPSWWKNASWRWMESQDQNQREGFCTNWFTVGKCWQEPDSSPCICWLLEWSSGWDDNSILC